MGNDWIETLPRRPKDDDYGWAKEILFEDLDVEVGPEPTPASSNASTPAGMSNGHATATGPNPPDHPPPPLMPLSKRYWH